VANRFALDLDVDLLEHAQRVLAAVRRGPDQLQELAAEVHARGEEEVREQQVRWAPAPPR
jgi:hypothetical protein